MLAPGRLVVHDLPDLATATTVAVPPRTRLIGTLGDRVVLMADGVALVARVGATGVALEALERPGPVEDVVPLDDDRLLVFERGALTVVAVPSQRVLARLTARLPWDHIDVGLEDGFLLAEYRKALKGRASPPCGKVAGMLVHHTNLADAEPDRRKLVCYDCGVACDLSTMRADRLVALRDLGAAAPRAAARALPVIDGDAALDVSERGGGSPAEQGGGGASASGRREHERADRVRKNGFHGADAPYTSYRLRYTKLGRTAFLGHLDVARLLARSFRRAHLELAMSRGFSPKPRITYGPALSLGVPSFAEVFDVDLQHGDGPGASWSPPPTTSWRRPPTACASTRRGWAGSPRRSWPATRRSWPAATRPSTCARWWPRSR